MSYSWEWLFVMIKRILVVCIGNICRSPMAEYMLQFKAQQRGIEAEIISAGIAACQGKPAHRYTNKVLNDYGMDASDHVAMQVNKDLVNWADLVLVMEHDHKRHLEKKYPSAKGKVFRLGEWMEKEIEDPNGKPLEEFEHAFKLMHYAADSWMNKIYTSMIA